MNTTTEIKKDVQSIATSLVIEHLKRGVIPWLMQWTEGGVPQNLIDHLAYRALNVFLLATLGYQKSFFLTQKQLHEDLISELGASLLSSLAGIRYGSGIDVTEYAT